MVVNLTGILAFVISFVVGIILVPVLIPVLKKLKFGQNIREEGPQSHQKKSGTPTMGGVAIVAAFFLGSIFFVGNGDNLWFVIAATLLFAAIGGLDDWLKIKHGHNEGLTAPQKFGMQAIVTVLMVIAVALIPGLGTESIIPFVGTVQLGFWFFPIALVAILGTVNGANFTDGLDGLASNVTVIIAGFLTVAAMILGYGLTPASLAMVAALLAFLCFNCYPAKIFMGDTGSLALGGFVAAMAFAMKIPVFLIFIAFIYLAEIVSVILQVGYFKLTHGKRLFRMAPLHHHFELGGWSEIKVVTVFTIVTVIGCVLGFVGLVL